MGPKLKFIPGQIIHHKRYNYRGVIYDVDEDCKANEEWYGNNRTQSNKNQPWYHVLVDGELQTTYVAEENIELDEDSEPVDHPMIEEIFSEFQNGRYIRELNS